MINKFESMYSRRDFITKIFRVGTLALVASVSGYLLFRKEPDEVCNFDFVCKNCKKLKACNLPEVKEFTNKNNKLKSS